MKNPFEKHGIAHLSPSSCTLFSSSPAMFVMKKCLNKNSAVGPAAYRGTAVEEGIVHGLMDPTASLQDCVDVAVNRFRILAAMCTGPKADKELAALPGMVEMGLAELKPYGVPSSTQGKIEYAFEGLSVPMIGFYDLEWEQHGILTDIKTKHTLPSSVVQSHARQVSLYRAARGDNLSARVSYITAKKHATYAVENCREHLEALRKIGLCIQRFLSISDDPWELASLVMPDTESFYFNDEVSRQQAFEVFGV